MCVSIHKQLSVLLCCSVWALPGKCLKAVFSLHMSLQATKYCAMGNIASKLRVQWARCITALSVSQKMWREVVRWSVSSELERVMKGSSCEIISDTVLVFAWRGWGEVWGTHQCSMLMAEIRMQDLQCTKQECCPAVCDVWCFLISMNKQKQFGQCELNAWIESIEQGL